MLTCRDTEICALRIGAAISHRSGEAAPNRISWDSLAMQHAPGDRFGPYEIAGRLGEGGMGEVYRARDTRLGRDVALKVLPLAWAGDAGRRSRFEREAQASAWGWLRIASDDVRNLYTDFGQPPDAERRVTF